MFNSVGLYSAEEVLSRNAAILDYRKGYTYRDEMKKPLNLTNRSINSEYWEHTLSQKSSAKILKLKILNTKTQWWTN